ncbi:MAG: DUF4153 domain-containing protein [Bacteroidetes bacterium]|nr:DUF4153 domain-containing protein [Bacteroidota bacterium]
MKLPSIPYLAAAFLGVVRRFPFVMVFATVGVFAAMYLIERDSAAHDDELGKMIMTCSLGLAIMLSASLVVEKWKLKQPLSLLPHIVGLVLITVYFFSLRWGNFDSIITPVRFVGLNLAAHLCVAFIPYLDHSHVEDFWEYNKRLFGNFMVGAFYSLVIFAGLSVAILAINELFDLRINEKIYAHLFIILAGIFNTAYFLSQFPKEFDFALKNYENQAIEVPKGTYTTAFKNLTKFILIPIIAIYFLILYAFSAKILVQWELPQGWVGKLVLGFSVAGIFTYLLNYLLVKFDDSQIVKGFRKWFFYVLLPMVILLFVAIGRRISDYGVTEARYVVATAGIWLLIISLYFIISKRDNIKFIPISLVFFCLITVLGPFSAFKVSERNQLSRLKAALLKNNMLQDGKMVVATDSLSKTDAETIRSAADFLQNNGHSEELAKLLGLAITDGKIDWQAFNDRMENLGIEQPYYDSKYCSVYFGRSNQNEIDIAGFNLLYQVYAYENSVPSNDFSGFQISKSGTALQYFKNGQVLDSFDLKPFCKVLEEKGACNGVTQPDSLADIELISKTLDLKILVDNLSFESEGTQKIREFNGKALVREKQ